MQHTVYRHFRKAIHEIISDGELEPGSLIGPAFLQMPDFLWTSPAALHQCVTPCPDKVRFVLLRFCQIQGGFGGGVLVL